MAAIRAAEPAAPVLLPPGPVMLAIDGLALSDVDRQRLLHPLVGGIVLFARNYRSVSQLRALTASLRALRSPALLIATDHEGGRFQSFRKGFTPIGPMRRLGHLWQRDPLAACQQATSIGRTIGGQLRRVGVDLAFGPVLDLDHARSGIIGDRAFDADPRVVAMLGRCLAHGLLLAGMANCGKHFPGHGFAAADSHETLPLDPRPLRTLLREDAAPYRWMGDTLLSVMPAHVVYPRVDSQPATYSRVWLRDILRDRLGFTGLVISDDLSMAAALGAGPITTRARRALAGGCDMVLALQREEADQLLAGRLRWKAARHFHDRLAAVRSPGAAPSGPSRP
ncbi:MAG: beta-N-acetylhexosaminidase [Burkholderiaceae bacterium]